MATFPYLVLSGPGALTRIGDPNSYDAQVSGALSTYMSFNHTHVELGRYSNSIKQTVASGNTTRLNAAFYTDSDYIEFTLENLYDNNFVVFVDDVRVKVTSTFFQTANSGSRHIVALFLNGKTTRKIDVWVRGEFFNVKVPKPHVISACPLTDAPKVLLIGDSQTQGTGCALDTADPFGNTEPGQMGCSFPVLALRSVGANAIVAAQGGTGWVNTGSTEAFGTRINTELGIITAGTLDAVLMVGSGNDKLLTLATVLANMNSACAAIRAHSPNAKLIFIGPVPTDNVPDSTWTTLDTGMANYMATLQGTYGSDVYWLSLVNPCWLNPNAATYVHSGGSHYKNSTATLCAAYVTTTPVSGYPDGFLQTILG